MTRRCASPPTWLAAGRDPSALRNRSRRECGPSIIPSQVEPGRWRSVPAAARRAPLDPRGGILIFTIFDEEDRVLEAVKAGASGYLLKGTPADKIVEAIKEGGLALEPLHP